MFLSKCSVRLHVVVLEILGAGILNECVGILSLCITFWAQVRELHTRASASRVHVPSAPASLRGFGSISQSLRAHLLGWRGAGSQSVRVTRPFSVSCSLLPFGVSSLVSPSLQSHVASSQSDNLRTTPYIGIPSVESRNPVVGLSLICEDVYVLSR